MGSTHLDRTGTDNYTLKIHNGAYAGAGISGNQGTIAKILFNSATSNGWNSFGAIGLETVGTSGGKGELFFCAGGDNSNTTERLRITQGGYIRIPDNGVLSVGTSDDLQIYHNETNSYISNGTGELLIRAKSGENSINCNPDGSVELFYDNAKKFETASGGVTVSGLVDATCFTATDGTGYSYIERTSPSDTNVPYNSYTTISSNYGWALPSAGTYLLVSMMRTRLWGVSGYIHCRLYDTTNSSAVSNTTRMMFEQGNSTSPMGWYNVAITLHWVHTCSGAVTINQQFSSNANDTGSSIQNDTNGRNYVYWQRIG
jgi:hypothetical protein